MRPIKFRVYNKDTKEIITPSEVITLRFEEKGRWFANNQDGTLFCNFLNGELLQFTGLYDKNSKEIYEGDVVRNTETASNYFDVVEYEILDFVGVIEWDNEGCDYNIDDKKGTVRGLGTGQQILEVIGNIYEHPELLKM